MAIAGRVLIIPRGVWSAETNYNMLDLVEYNSSCWLAKKASIGLAPSNVNSEYWMKMNSPALANALNINETGFALDAYQGKVLKDLITAEAAARVVVETSVTNLTATVNGLMGTSIAEEYDSTSTYAVGDYVVYNNDLYKCSTAIETPEVFDITHWTHCYIMEEIDDKVTEIVEEIVNTNVATQLADLSTSIAPVYSASQTYAVGDHVMKDSKLYKCTTAISTAEAWDPDHWTADSVQNEVNAVNENLTAITDNGNITNVRINPNDANALQWSGNGGSEWHDFFKFVPIQLNLRTGSSNYTITIPANTGRKYIVQMIYASSSNNSVAPSSATNGTYSQVTSFKLNNDPISEFIFEKVDVTQASVITSASLNPSYGIAIKIAD